MQKLIAGSEITEDQTVGIPERKSKSSPDSGDNWMIHLVGSVGTLNNYLKYNNNIIFIYYYFFV